MAPSASHCKMTDQKMAYQRVRSPFRVTKQREQDQRFLPVRGYFVAQLHDSQILV
jgi:hypothetical protein